jgi:hypothetical protein
LAEKLKFNNWRNDYAVIRQMHVVQLLHFCWDSAVIGTSHFNPAIFASNPRALSIIPRELFKGDNNPFCFEFGWYNAHLMNPPLGNEISDPLHIPDALAKDIETLFSTRERNARNARIAKLFQVTGTECLTHLKKPSYISHIRQALQKRQNL